MKQLPEEPARRDIKYPPPPEGEGVYWNSGESGPVDRYIHAMSSEVQIVLCTVPDRETANTISNALVAEQLAACVNIIPGITSVYRWKGVVEKDDELLLLIKAAVSSWPRLEQRIQALHPYELPEIIAVPIQTGQKDYIQWIIDSLN